MYIVAFYRLFCGFGIQYHDFSVHYGVHKGIVILSWLFLPNSPYPALLKLGTNQLSGR